ncbi:hypothetical protein KFL_003830110 [Klebsormidium nitens]|uniref:Uncharacterized protein n=1 Tax=Klebsormidium nitens TaxID=105231 RepID=A0A1Y1ID42_KLENI|nr:hypothetical protein KFL_003830110 [Klebsormidium nitens]|eukprot:GAQ87862.1 hypothetical protein KFL_003830110 [Klebsormidium nitens]
MAAAQAVLAAPWSSQAAPAARRKVPFSAAEASCAGCGCPSKLSPSFKKRIRNPLHTTFAHAQHSFSKPSQSRRSCIVRAVEKEENVPTWAKPGSEEVPPWAKEDSSGYQKEGPKDLPFGLYLLFSVFTAIAAVGSIYEFANKNPIFGVIQPDSGLYVPILGFFVLSGFPTAGFLLYKAISTANKLAEAMDKEDGVNKDY